MTYDRQICMQLTHATTKTKSFLIFENKHQTYFVTPGVDPTVHALDLFKLLITLLFPTLGKPTTPTVIDVLMF